MGQFKIIKEFHDEKQGKSLLLSSVGATRL